MKCDKQYGDMRQLRRHDWRSHRSIECIICNEKLDSRQDISMHRQTKHRMFRKMACKFFPDCYDGEECLYEHAVVSYETCCSNGESCSDQSCLFSEKNHRKLNQILCTFQARCNRSGCQFRHSVGRQAFLGESPLESRKR